MCTALSARRMRRSAVVVATFAALLVARGVALPDPFPDAVEVNFQPADTPRCANEQYVDAGFGLGPRTGDLFYGWVEAGTDRSVSAAGVRWRDFEGAACEERTLMHMQFDDCCNGPRGFPGPLEWEFHLPNGQYRITATAGDYYLDSTHFLRETYSGATVLAALAPSRHQQFFTGVADIDVRDGKIRLTAQGGGRNTKINVVRIEKVGHVGDVAAEVAMEGPCVPIPSDFEGKSISPLACSQVVVDLPHKLSFEGDQMGLLDLHGKPTGLRMYVPSTRLKYPYLKQQIVMNSERRELEVLGQPGTWEGHTNNLRNALGVGLPLPTYAIRLQVTVHMPESIAETDGESFCLFLAVSDQEFAWLCAAKQSGSYKLRARYEYQDEEQESAESGPLYLSPGREITLQMDIDPYFDTIQTSYAINGREKTPFRTLTVKPFTMNKDIANTDDRLGSRTNGGFVALVPPGWTEQMTFRVRNFEATELASSAPNGQGADDMAAVDFDTWRVPGIQEPTSIVWGGDRLWVATAAGYVHAIDFDADRRQVTGRRAFRPIGSRLLLGITTDPDYAANRCLWLSHSSSSRHAGDANSGTITRVCGADLAQTEDVINGLPRAIANHATNNLWFHERRLFIAVGGNTGSGAPNRIHGAAFSTRPEQYLAASILVADVFADAFEGDCTPKQDPDEMDATGISDETDIPACDVRNYATGLRNVFSCVQHLTLGKLYCPDNAIGGKGTFPVLPPGYEPGDKCEGIIEDANVANHDPGVRLDPLLLVEEGSYYGHPNPVRRECVMVGANPTERHLEVPVMPVQEGITRPAKETQYPLGTRPDPRFVKPLAYFGLNRSPNGVIAYRSNRFCGALKDQLLVTWFSVDPQVHHIKLSADGTSVVSDGTLIRSTSATGGSTINSPIGIDQDDDGNLFVAEFGGNAVVIFNPKDSGCGSR